MKIPLLLTCNNCSQERYVDIDLVDSSYDWGCECGEKNLAFFSGNLTIGVRLLFRSKYECLEKKDYSLSIVFSATAMECELSRLFFKWREIEALNNGSEDNDEEFEGTLRNLGNIDKKIEKIAKMMDSRGIIRFVRETLFLREMIEKGFPSLCIDDLAKGFQKNLFWPRNKILHLGNSLFGLEDAIKCFNISTLGIKIFEVLDRDKEAKKKN